MKTFLKVVCSSLMIISVSTIFAQKNVYDRKNQLKLSPFRLIDLVNPGIDLSYERRQNERLSTQLSFGVMNDFFKLMPFTDYSGTRISLEEKYFPKSKKTNEYYSLEAVYLNARYKTNSYFVQDTALGTPEYNDSFRIAKQSFTFNLKYGIQIPLKRFIVDISAGVGLKYKMVKRMDVFDRKAYEVTSRHSNIYDLADKEGNHLTINIPFNIRFGYTF